MSFYGKINIILYIQYMNWLSYGGHGFDPQGTYILIKYTVYLKRTIESHFGLKFMSNTYM